MWLHLTLTNCSTRADDPEPRAAAADGDGGGVGRGYKFYLSDQPMKARELPACLPPPPTQTRSFADESYDLMLSTTVYERGEYVRNLLYNLLAFTTPRTLILVHLSSESKVDCLLEEPWWPALEAAARGRVLVNPERKVTLTQTGSILRQHVSNFAYAFGRGASSRHVMLFASKDRLLKPGLESFVSANRFSRIKYEHWITSQCEPGMAKHELYFDALRSAAAAAGNGTECAASFFRHEGAFFPEPVMRRFLGFLRGSTVRAPDFPPADGKTLLELMELQRRLRGGWAVEEVWLQVGEGGRERDLGFEILGPRAPARLLVACDSGERLSVTATGCLTVTLSDCKLSPI